MVADWNLSACGRGRGRVVPLRVKGISIRRRVGVIYRKDAYLPPVGRRFIELLKEAGNEIGKERR